MTEQSSSDVPSLLENLRARSLAWWPVREYTSATDVYKVCLDIINDRVQSEQMPDSGEKVYKLPQT